MFLHSFICHLNWLFDKFQNSFYFQSSTQSITLNTLESFFDSLAVVKRRRRFRKKKRKKGKKAGTPKVMHYNHTQTNEPPPPLLCTLSLSPKVPIQNFHYTPVSFKSIGGLQSSKKNNAISQSIFQKKKRESV